jgi:hypothetical protein
MFLECLRPKFSPKKSGPPSQNVCATHRRISSSSRRHRTACRSPEVVLFSSSFCIWDSDISTISGGISIAGGGGAGLDFGLGL